MSKLGIDAKANGAAKAEAAAAQAQADKASSSARKEDAEKRAAQEKLADLRGGGGGGAHVGGKHSAGQAQGAVPGDESALAEAKGLAAKHFLLFGAIGAVLFVLCVAKLRRKPASYQPIVSTDLDIEEYKRRINAKYHISMSESVDLSSRFAV